MFDNVLIGVNDSASGATAVALATALGAGALTLAAVDRRAAASLLTQVGERAGVDAELVTLHGRSPGRALSHAARERGSDLLVLGPHDGEVVHFTHGDTARLAVHHTACPVAIARAGAVGAERPRTVAVGYDGSPSSRAALAVASAWAGEHAAALTVLTMWQGPVVRDDVPTAEVAVAAANRAQRQLDDALAGLPGRTAGRVIHGRTEEKLGRIAETVDLLVVGAGERSPVRRGLVGSTADWLMRHAECPVLVVPAAAVPATAHDDLATTAGA